MDNKNTLAKLTSTMDSSQWKLVRELFDTASDLPLQERAGFLEANCRDAEARQQVEELLSAQQEAGAFLQAPVAGAREGIFQQFDSVKPQISTGMLLKERYRVVEKIGEGGFGDVYTACDEQLAGRRVVVKSQRKGQSANVGWLSQRFQQEMEALARIDHSGVASVYDIGEGPGGDPFLVMQYVPGGTLREAMKAGPMPIARVARLALCIAEALDAAHGVDVLHRDLKPENIILRDPGTPKEAPVLIDFGIARVDARPGSTTVHVAGSPMYMSPEQLMGRTVPASDQYSLALILFELLVGTPLYELETGRSPGEAAEIELRKLHPCLPDAARGGMARALSLEPSARFGKAVDLAIVLLPPTRRRIGLFAAAAGAGALAMAGAFFGLRAGPQAEILYSVSQQSGAGELLVDPGAVAFQAGDKIRLRFSAGQPGYLYLLNEGVLSTADLPQFVLLHALPLAARVAATVPSDGHWIEFDREKGTERIWMVWSKTPIAQLEALRHFMNARYQGEIADGKSARNLAAAVAGWRGSALPPLYNNGLNAVLLRSATDQIIGKIELRHE